MTNANSIDPSDLIPAELAADQYPHLFTRSQFNWLMRRREKNGLHHAIVRVGEKRLFISRSRFSEWLAKRVEEPEQIDNQ